MIEALLAITILVALFLSWGTAMIIASDSENKAGNHTQVVATANQILEWVRRDPNFWLSTSHPNGEYDSAACPHCWTSYDDTIGVTSPRSCSTVPQVQWSGPKCTFNWIAVEDPAVTSDPKASTLADITVVVYFIGNNHQTEKYTVMGLVRED
jgi:type II secretory pathway pseudopilin PulG